MSLKTNEVYSDGILTIKKLGDGVEKYTFRAPKGMSEKNLISTFLIYFIPEIPYFSKEAQINLIKMAYELCKDKLSKADEKYLNMLEHKDAKTINTAIWNKILAPEGLIVR